ncbi:hypothetical protein [Mycolicibacterium pallens]|uniref:Peptidase C39-like domain-containing protein n=1 Tax=Mycolicibacterium pallens TaxID=370524 RepID=A0ABX8VP25_9MYCO|nr:hypothetical protein [Mycolicibacterium pallens]APE16803.1 hypothetical protein BOH72_17690 [Mycobacterium sp. WY10]QYL17731.1 hypothetical protein K0O64_03985 [Mycolicibacterium pallens]
MASARLVGQVGTLAFGVGVGFLVAMGCDGAVAAAAPGDTGHSGAGSANSAHAASSGRSHAAPQSALNTPKPVAAQSSSTINSVPTSVSKSLATAKATPAAPHLPTPVEVQQAVTGAVQNARRDLVALEHRVEAEIKRDVTGLSRALGVIPAKPRIYGNLANAQYWATQSAENCVLMATASVIGQLKGTMPTEQQIADQATSTQSVVDPTRKMYLGLTTDDRVAIGDAEELLRLNGIDATTKTDYKKTQGLIALHALERDLKAGKAIMVGVKADAIWNYLHATPPPGAVAEAADHEISVIAINATTRTVYINDSGMDKGGVAVPLAVFMRAWQADSYETTSAVLAEAASAALAA